MHGRVARSVRQRLQPGSDLDLSVLSGLFEGAYYSPLGYFRARLGCRMRELEPGTPFCEACDEVAGKTLGPYGNNALCAP